MASHFEVQHSILLCGQPFWGTTLHFALWPAISRYKQFATSAPNEFNMTEYYKAKGTLHVHGVRLPLSPKCHSVSLYNQPFSSCRPFWDKCTKWPKWSWTLQGQRYPYMVYYITPFRSMVGYKSFWSHFETSALNDLKMTLTGQDTHYMVYYYPHEFQISLRFCRRPAFYCYKAILRHMHWIIPTPHPNEIFPSVCAILRKMKTFVKNWKKIKRRTGVWLTTKIWMELILAQ